MPNTRTPALLKQLDRWVSLASLVLALGLAAIYFLWPQPPETAQEARAIWNFSTSLITNFIPVLLVFWASYFLYGRVQEIRSAETREQLVEDVATRTQAILSTQFQTIETKVQATAHLVRDWEGKGVERVYDLEEVKAASLTELQLTNSFRILGIGNGWLLEGKHFERLKQMLQTPGSAVIVMMPDPLSPQTIERYEKDEPKNKAKLTRKKLGEKVLQWADLRSDFPSLKIRASNRYPMMNVSIYDRRVHCSPVLYQSRAIDGLTFSFRKHSLGAELYEAHFANVFATGSVEIDSNYIERISQFVES